VVVLKNGLCLKDMGLPSSKNPDLIKEMIRCTRQATNNTLPVSVKIRVFSDVRETIELVKRAESMNVSWITVHGRTPQQKSESPLNWEAVKLVQTK